MGQSRGQRRSRSRAATSEAALAAARNPARRRRLAADATRTGWFGTWHYWWQAHLLDCLVDAQLRDPQPDREKKIARQIRAHRLAQQRILDQRLLRRHGVAGAGPGAGGPARRRREPGALKKLSDQFVNAWVPEDGGGIPWRKQDQFFNAPANGPAGIFLARYDDRLRRAQQMSDWIDDTLIDPETHLVFDGLKAGSLVRAQYTYCQGVVLGLGNRARRAHRRRRSRASACTGSSPRSTRRWRPSGVIKGAGGGDGGLFNGILARYLALVVTTLPDNDAEDAAARDTARNIVLKSAQSAWDYRQTVDGLPLFGPFWDRAADLPHGGRAGGRSSSRAPSTASAIPERDLSVQLSGWMLMEAAHAIQRRKHRHDRTRGLDTRRKNRRARQSHPLHGVAGRNRSW